MSALIVLESLLMRFVLSFKMSALIVDWLSIHVRSVRNPTKHEKGQLWDSMALLFANFVFELIFRWSVNRKIIGTR